ncbi:ABC transporter ATP-binding protein [Leucothrix sargassi]|nr:ABC transporter ATP-binding protein [Leucothrix sargassi]
MTTMNQTITESDRVIVPVWGNHKPNIRRFWELVLHANRKIIAQIFVAQTVAAIALLGLPITLSILLKELIKIDTASGVDYQKVTVFILLFLFFELLQFQCQRFCSKAQTLSGTTIRHTAMMCLYEHLLQHSKKFTHQTQSGALTSSVMEAAHAITAGLWIVIVDLWPTFLVTLLATLLIFSIDPTIGIIVVLWCLAFSYFTYTAARRRNDLAKKSSKTNTGFVGKLSDIISNSYIVRAFTAVETERESLLKNYQSTIDEEGTYTWQSHKDRFRLDASSHLFRIIAVVGATLWISGSEFNIVELLLVILLTNLSIRTATQGTLKVDRFLQINAEIYPAVDNILQQHDIRFPERSEMTAQAKPDLSVKNISFSYLDNIKTIDGISLTIPYGQKVAVVGSSGSGKSTFSDLLLRQYDVSHGEILFNETNIKDLTQDVLYRLIGSVSQSTVLFNRTVFENITYGQPQFTMDDVIRVAKQTNCHEFIAELPKGYETLVGESGLKLSGGQRQRLLIARTLLHDPSIVILDEATSALDSKTEQHILQQLKDIWVEKTVITIAHRLSTVVSSDRIIVMSHGKIIEDGSHEALLAKQGKYADLWKAQTTNTDAVVPEASNVIPLHAEANASLLAPKKTDLETVLGTELVGREQLVYPKVIDKINVLIWAVLAALIPLIYCIYFSILPVG